MTSTDPDELEHVYAQWPTERLVKAIAVEADQYNFVAIPVMKRVLDARGVTGAELDALLDEARSGKQNARSLVQLLTSAKTSEATT